MSFKLQYKVAGGKKTIERMQNLKAQYPNKMAMALIAEGEQITTLAKERAPFKTGRLIGSAGTAASGESTDPVITSYFGTDYALPVHERHKTKGKFLESAFNERLPGLFARVAKRINDSVKMDQKENIQKLRIDRKAQREASQKRNQDLRRQKKAAASSARIANKSAKAGLRSANAELRAAKSGLRTAKLAAIATKKAAVLQDKDFLKKFAKLKRQVARSNGVKSKTIKAKKPK